MKSILIGFGLSILSLCLVDLAQGQIREADHRIVTTVERTVMPGELASSSGKLISSGQVPRSALRSTISRGKTGAGNFTVYAAYPNPFRCETRLSYYLSKEGRVHVSISDLNGRLFKMWTAASSTGKQELVWDGTDASGNELKAGIYFCTLDYDGLKKVFKLMKVN
jgi:FlgD Ig-like domain